MGTAQSNAVATRAHALVSLSEGLSKDRMLARQPRRKLCARRSRGRHTHSTERVC